MQNSLLNPDETHLLALLCTCQRTNVALAEELAKGLNINLLDLLKKEGFFELGILKPTDFVIDLLEGKFMHKKISSLYAIKYFPKLRNLYCYNNKLSDLKGIEALTNLESLDCSANTITDISGIENLTELTDFVCYSNHITCLKNIHNLQNLIRMDITDNFIEDISPLFKLPYLHRVDMYLNHIPAAQIAELRLLNPDCEVNDI